MELAVYKCKTDSCAGIVEFGENKKAESLIGSLRTNRRFAMIMTVKDKPVECPVCNKSYYEWELK